MPELSNQTQHLYRIDERMRKIETYKIVRKYFNYSKYPDEVVVTGLTKEEAQDWCINPEGSSQTCQDSAGLLRTERCGPWFEAFTKE